MQHKWWEEDAYETKADLHIIFEGVEYADVKAVFKNCEIRTQGSGRCMAWYGNTRHYKVVLMDIAVLTENIVRWHGQARRITSDSTTQYLIPVSSLNKPHK